MPKNNAIPRSVKMTQRVGNIPLPDGYEIFVMPADTTMDALWKGVDHPSDQYPSHLVYVAEPFSWAAVGKLILEAAVKAIATAIIGAIVNALAGRPVDLAQLIRDTMLAFANLVRQIVEEDRIREATANLSAIRFSMEAYARDPSSRGGTLDALTLEARRNVEQLKSLSVPATGAYTIGASLELGINLQRYALSRSDGDWTTCEMAAREFKAHIEVLHKALIEQTAGRFSQLIVIPDIGMHPGPWRYFYNIGRNKYLRWNYA